MAAQGFGLLLGLATLLGAGSCSILMGTDPPADGTDNGTGGSTPDPEGYVAVVFLNHSKALVQNVIAVEYKGLAPQIWATPVTPESWDSLLVDCPFQRIRVLGTTPVDLETGLEGAQVVYDGDLLADGANVTCGSMVVVETTDSTNPTGSVTLDVRTVPTEVAGRFAKSAFRTGTPAHRSA